MILLLLSGRAETSAPHGGERMQTTSRKPEKKRGERGKVGSD